MSSLFGTGEYSGGSKVKNRNKSGPPDCIFKCVFVRHVTINLKSGHVKGIVI